uniref:Uncharacterized protein n=1 Tax=Trichobilharzia regenti TaxID=157069 RepID=A0AA85IS36_TRIRE|nr:unnamed protein product [Trichobilharzia regenti]
MRTRVWFTIIPSILLYIMYLPQCESGFFISIFCWLFSQWSACRFYNNPYEFIKNLTLSVMVGQESTIQTTK